jgi:TrmH family RNA methyltransferase
VTRQVTQTMSTEPHAAQITIILVRPQSPGNIGAAARAMHNMGLHRLALVAPEHFPHPEARMLACHAEHLLHQAVVYDSLAAAVATCHWLVGTSARHREYRHPPLTPRQFAHTLPALSAQHPHVGILFGPEDTGLTTAELDLCSGLVVIPTVPEATSLNLAQAVLVLGYELMQVHYQVPSQQGPPLASVDEIEAMYAHFRAAFSLHGFSGSHAIERSLMGIRRICERAGLERRDVRLLRGMARQLAWALRHPRQGDGTR